MTGPRRGSAQRCLVVLVTCPTRPKALALAEAVVRKRLAACATLLSGAESRFWWEGKIDRARETLLILKTTAGRFEQLRRAILRLHSYDVPEIIALPISVAHPPYLQWVRSSCG